MGQAYLMYVAAQVVVRLRNHNATDDGNVGFRYFKKVHIQSLENKYKAVELLVQ